MDTLWHHDGLTVDGLPYWTRHRVPRHLRGGRSTPTTIALGLSEEQLLASTAAHELGHALLYLAGGMHVTRITTVPDATAAGRVYYIEPHANDDARALVIAAAAGERAQDRWLREAGLWTPGRASVVEMFAQSDRAVVLDSITPRPVFGASGDGDIDYSVFQDMADAELDRLWDRLMSALPLLLKHRVLTGEQLARYVDLPLAPLAA